MNGHKLSNTRQWNRHWQSGEEGGGYPPVPVYPSFADFPCNEVLIPTHYITQGSFGKINLEVYSHTMHLLLDENRIYIELPPLYNPQLYNIRERYVIPKNLEFQLKDKVYFNTDDLFNQYPNGFHHFTMKTSTLTFYGENIEFYEIERDQNYTLNECYIEYNFERATINKENLPVYVYNIDNDNIRYYYDTWNVIGHPKPSPFDRGFHFDKNVNNLKVKRENNVGLTGMFVAPYNIELYYATYDINDMFAPSGSLNVYETGGYVFYRWSGFTVDGIGSPTFNSLWLNTTTLPSGYYDDQYNWIPYLYYDNVEVSTGTWYAATFDVDNANNETILSNIKFDLT